MSEKADAPIINFQGELVGLGPIRREYVPLYQRWMNDFATTRFLEIQPRPMTLDQETILERYSSRKLKTRYYSPELHLGAFHIPPFFAEKLK